MRDEDVRQLIASWEAFGNDLRPALAASVKALTGFAESVRGVVDALSIFIPISEEALRITRSRTACFIELMTWGIPERPARWFVDQLPDSVILHFAEMINR